MAGVSETRVLDSVLTTTMERYADKKLHDSVFDEYPTLSWLNGKLGEAMRGEKRLQLVGGGESIVVPILYEQSSAVQTYSMYETIDLTAQDGITKARYSWRQYAAAVTIAGLEERNNQGEDGVIDLLEAKIMQAENSLRDRMSRDVWGTAVGGSDGKSIDGLGILVDSAGTVGGLSASTYTTWAATERAGGSFAAQGLNDMRVVFNTITYGNNKPDFLVAPQAVFEYFESVLEPKERYTNTKAANAGFENLTFKAVPFLFDRDCISGNIFFLNSKTLKFVVHKDANLKPGPFVTPDNQDAKSSKILWQGNLITNERRKNGKITGITA